ncbi:MAG: hypothetical protein IJY42_01915, partial [Clostridia bacterium]|nr:hypothetical protein [Clostridia bacterium]
FFATEQDAFEVKIGPYVADLAGADGIVEIQCGSFRPLRQKLAYYQEQGFTVTVVHPMAVDLHLIRADRESGEVLRSRRYRQYHRPVELMSMLYDLCGVLPQEGICVKLLLYRGEEMRYSERIRYRKSGAFDAERYPRELLDVWTFACAEDYSRLLPADLPSAFGAAEAGKLLRMKGRKLYSALNTWVSFGILRREKQGRSYRYVRVASV